MKSEKRLKAEAILRKFPNTSLSSLAGTLYNKNKLLYKDQENARTMLRKAAGKRGEVDKKYAVVKQDNRPNGIVYNPYQLPAEIKQSTIHEIKIDGTTRMAILSDLHFPFVCNTSLTAALDYCKEFKPTHIILNGDVLDFYSISRFDRNPDAENIKYEVDVVRNFLDSLKEHFPNVQILYKAGNHELRFEHFIWRKAPEIWGFEEFRLDNLLKLKERGIQWIGDKILIKAGKLNIAHGHEFPRSMGSVNVARTFYLKAKTNIVGAHHHQISSYSTRDVNGTSHVAYSTGCLCQLNPDYMSINDWDNGFMTVTFESNGNFRANNLKIIDGKIY